jgi:anti-anti-sigma factor
MSSLSPKSSLPVPATDAADLPPAWENHSARFSAYSDSSGVVIAADGELDASNASELADYVERCVTETASVVVDLSGLKFFGTAGFSALHLINVRCAGTNQRWALVPSNAVSRLLQICDPDSTLPLVGSVSAFHEGEGKHPDPNRLFQLVT